MNKPYEYVMFKTDDHYELPIKYFDSLNEIAETFGYNKDYLSMKFKTLGNIIEVNDTYSIERFRKEGKKMEENNKGMKSLSKSLATLLAFNTMTSPDTLDYQERLIEKKQTIQKATPERKRKRKMIQKSRRINRRK